MIKKTLLLFTGLLVLTGNLLTANDTKHCMCNIRPLTTTEKVLIGGLVVFVGVPAIITAAPYIIAALPAAKIAAAVKVAAATASPYIVPTTTIGKASYVLSAAQMARPLIVQTTEEKCDRLLEEKALRPARAKNEFVGCLRANKTGSPRNAAGIPAACEDAALCYALNSSMAELNQKTVAFKNNKCFCH